MSEEDYYPAGAYRDPDAPYNQYDPPEEEFTCSVSQTFEKKIKIRTSNYVQDFDFDEDTGDRIPMCDTSETNWNEVFNNQGMGLVDLIGELKRRISEDISSVKDSKELVKLTKLKNACDGWVLTEQNIEEI